MKYIIDIPDDRIGDFVGSTHLLMPYTMAGHEGHHDTKLDLTPYTEPDRKAIEDEVWEMARLISLEVDDGGLRPADLCECYKHSSVQEVMKKHSYQETKVKYEAWKNQKDEIRVGDEVVLYENIKMVVTQVDHRTSIQGIDENGECYESIETNVVKKTGRHFDEIEELLKKMRGEE